MSDEHIDVGQGYTPNGHGLNRREFAATATAAMLSGWSSFSQAQPLKEPKKMRHDTFSSIDIHAHFLPPTSEPSGAAKDNFKKPVIAAWRPEQAITFMDDHGIDVQMLSLPLPPTSSQEVRANNEYGASIVSQFPTRFGLLASLPMNDVAASLAEITHSFDVLKADGIALVTNYEEKYLGNERFDPVWEALNRRKATVFIHPCSPACFQCLALGRPGPVLEFPMDTTRTAVDMLFAGVFDRFPDINFILAHGGGGLATLAHRVADILEQPWCPNPRGLTEASALKALSTIYFDTALASHNGALWPVVELAGAGQLVFGTDFPAAPLTSVKKNMASLKAFPGFKGTALNQIGQTTAGLFRRFDK